MCPTYRQFRRISSPTYRELTLYIYICIRLSLHILRTIDYTCSYLNRNHQPYRAKADQPPREVVTPSLPVPSGVSAYVRRKRNPGTLDSRRTSLEGHDHGPTRRPSATRPVLGTRTGRELSVLDGGAWPNQ